MATKYKIILTPEERIELDSIVKKGKTSLGSLYWLWYSICVTLVPREGGARPMEKLIVNLTFQKEL
jgi:hypothetical protein